MKDSQCLRANTITTYSILVFLVLRCDQVHCHLVAFVFVSSLFWWLIRSRCACGDHALKEMHHLQMQMAIKKCGLHFFNTHG